jgi:hypothetical protein
MATKIITKNGSGTPSSGALDTGELAVDLTNAKLYSSTDGTDIIEISPEFDGQLADGTVSAPSLTFSGDTDVGIYRTGSYGNEVSFCGGSTHLATIIKGATGATFLLGDEVLSAALSSQTAIEMSPDNIAMARFWNSNSTSQPLAFFTSGGTTAGVVSCSGNTTTYGTTSDYRLKTDVVPMTGALARVNNLNPVNFQWIASGTRVDGFIAHELQAIVPEAVVGEKDAVYYDNVLEEERPLYQNIDQAKLVPLLVAAIQELTARIEALEGA